MREPPLQAGRDCCLFSDIDGTLPHLAPSAGDVCVDEPLRNVHSELRLRRPDAVRRWSSSLLPARKAA